MTAPAQSGRPDQMVGSSMFLYMALDRRRSKLALARKELATIDRDLDVDRR